MQRRLFPVRLRSNSRQLKRDNGQPRMYIISGCNGSGKTTASYTVLPEILKCREFVNSDEFAKALSPFNPSEASISASRMMVLRIKYLIGQRLDFGVETTLATRSLKKIIFEAREQGYFVTLLYFWLNSKDIAISRVKDRVANGGHNLPEEVIRRRYDKGLKYFFDDYRYAVDSWILADNSTYPFKIVSQGWKDNMIVKDNIKYEAIKQYADSLNIRVTND